MVANKFLEEVELSDEIRIATVFLCKHFHESVRQLSQKSVTIVAYHSEHNYPCTSDSHSAISLFGVGASSFHSQLSPVLCLFSLCSFLLCVFLYNISPPQCWSSYLSVYIHFYVLIISSSSGFLSTCPNH